MITLRLTLVLWLAILAGCSNPNPRTTMTPNNQSLLLSEGEKVQLEKVAQAGDGAAAFRLFEYYEFGVFNHELSLRWLRSAAENGHVVAQFNLGYLLIEEHMQEKRDEGVKWLRAAASKGYVRAIDVLRDRVDVPSSAKPPQ